MKATTIASILLSLAFPLVALAAEPAVEPAPDRAQLDFFEKSIRPVLAAKCYPCHSADSEKLKGGLLLDTREGIRRGGDSGHAVVPRSLGESLLIKAIRYTDDDLKMPPSKSGGKLPESILADFEKWVQMGAPDPRDGAAKVVSHDIDFTKAREFWSFQPLHTAPAPKVAAAKWPRTDIDRFILAAQEAKGLKPVADAEPAAWLRRVYFDLIGLPPTPAEVQAFVKECGTPVAGSAARLPNSALEKVVDRLLASPQFGERWGRHWLDVARYAESTGRERNFAFPDAWRYRDYVIAAFNADKPYDQFVREQIAGDLLPSKGAVERNEHLIATGFLAIGPKGLNEKNREQFTMDLVDEQLDTTTRAVMGLTVSCARCHDHKFDPIPTRDYYAMAGIFRSTKTYFGVGADAGKNRQPSEPLPLMPLTARTNAPVVKPASVPAAQVAPARAQAANATKKQLRQQQKLQQKQKKAAPPPAPAAPAREPGGDTAIGVLDGRLADCPIYLRGEVETRGAVVPRGFVQVLAAIPAEKISAKQSGRLELANWMTHSENPLTARVMANRVWQHLFGEGLVTTADNFGATGERPSHPELLDYLSRRFMTDGWSVKKLVRSIVLSRVYQLSSANDAKNLAADPDNILRWRSSPRRLDAESIRDAMLAVSGRLDLKPPRGSVVSQLGDAPIGGGVASVARAAGSSVRSVYLPIIRDRVPDVLELFDFAEPSLVVANRDVTTVPSQALFMLNSPFVAAQSEAMAQRLLAMPAADGRQRIDYAYLWALSRAPTDAERKRAEDYLRGAGPKLNAADKTWATFCQALLASAEFRYLK